MRAAVAKFLAVLAPVLLLVACTAPRVTPPPEPTRSASPKPTFVPVPALSPTPSPTPAVAASLTVGGMATVHLDDIPQLVDPEHPNHDRDISDSLGTLSAGDRVFLANQLRVKGVSWWQIVPEEGVGSLPLGWIPQLVDGELTLDPFRPECPSTFPLSGQDLAAVGGLQALSCFGNQELTLTGTVHCERSNADYGIGGAGYLDASRECKLDDAFTLYGRAVTSLLDTPTSVEVVDGRYLVRGHFDDPEAQNCSRIPFGTDPSGAIGPPEPAAVIACRQHFVVSNVTPLD